MQEPRELYADMRTVVPDAPKLDETDPVGKAHMTYFTRLREQGKLLMAGPFKEERGGLVIFSTSSKEEAIELSNNDPLIATGNYKPNVRAWSVGIY